jgi:HEAT repeat protein
MELEKILNNKEVKAKAKTETISKMLLDKKIDVGKLIEFAQTSKDPVKATCIEAIEFATKSKPGIASLVCLDFVTKTLVEKAPRVKWESAKVIGNIAHLYPAKLDEAIKNLLVNSEHPGTVVRWSAAFALGQIIKIKTKRNKDLIPAIESICKLEEQNSIRKIYLDALKKVKE